MKYSFLIVLFFSVKSYSQGLTFLDLATLNKAPKTTYQKDPDKVLDLIAGFRGKGFLIGSHEYAEINALHERIDGFTFLDLNTDNIKEQVGFSTTYGSVFGVLGYTVAVSDITDNLAQYQGWLTAMKATPNFKRTIYQPFTETYEASGSLTSTITIVFTINFHQTINNPPQNERMETNSPPTYTITILRVTQTGH